VKLEGRDGWGLKRAEAIRLAYRDWQDNSKGVSWVDISKTLLLMMPVFFFTSCTPIYIPQKVYIKTPIWCHPAIVPPFINYISPIRPMTKLEREILVAEVEVTLKEAIIQEKLLRTALKDCEKP
jgi:hypothetical protein